MTRDEALLILARSCRTLHSSRFDRLEKDLLEFLRVFEEIGEGHVHDMFRYPKKAHYDIETQRKIGRLYTYMFALKREKRAKRITFTWKEAAEDAAKKIYPDKGASARGNRDRRNRAAARFSNYRNMSKIRNRWGRPVSTRH